MEQRTAPVVLTAAGRKIDMASMRDARGIEKRPLDWQRRSYNFYDPGSETAIGEVWFAGRYVSESLSRVRLVPAIQVFPDEDPVPLNEQGLSMLGDLAPPEDELKLVRDATNRLTNSHGGQADIMRGAALNNFLAGESFLIGRTIDGMEEWEVHSVDAVEMLEPPTPSRPTVYGLKILPGDGRSEMEPLDDATVIRIWRRHPRFPELPDASMGAALTYCEDLYALTQMIRSAARSRMPSGILKYPSTVAPINPDEDDPDQDTPQDSFMESLIRHFSEPIKNPNDAAALVPFLLRMDPEDLQYVEMIDFSREIDSLAVDLRRESREAFAATIDLPADVMSGKQGLNDWSAWNVDEETFRVHLASHAELIVDALTAGYLWPTLASALLEDPRRYRIWYDASNLIVHPNKAENAKDLHQAFVISDATLRDSGGFDESDAPDEEEVARRIEIERARAGTRAEPPAPGGPENGPPSPQDTSPVVAAAGVPVDPVPQHETLGWRLGMIEQRLMDRLHVAADELLRQALVRASNRIVSSARKRATPEAIRLMVADAPQGKVAARVGETLLATLSLTTDALLDGAFDALEGRWYAWVEQAHSDMLDAIDEFGTPLTDEQRAEFLTRMADDRENGWAVLRDALMANAAEVLYQEQQPSSLTSAGRPDDGMLLDPEVLRAPLAIAGGGPRLGSPSKEGGPGGLVDGQTMADLFPDGGTH